MQFKRHFARPWQRGAFLAVASCSLGSLGRSRKREGTAAVAEGEDNPLLPKSSYMLPLFNEVRAHHVKTATDLHLRHLKRDFSSLVYRIEKGEAKEYETIVEELERMKGPLESSLAIVEHLLMVTQNDSLKFAHNRSLTSVIPFYQEMAQSPSVLSGLLKLKNDTKLWSSFTPIQRQIINIQICEMQKNGLQLSPTDKDKLNELQIHLAHLQAKYNNNVFKSTQGFQITLKKQSSVEGMPESLKRLLAQNAIDKGHPSATAATGPWVVTLDNYHPCMRHLKSRKMRRVLYKQHIAKAKTTNSFIVHDILKDRQDLANLLGFKNYADLSLDSKMAPDVATVLDLFATLRASALPVAQREMRELKEFVKSQQLGVEKNGGGGDEEEDNDEILAEWDIPYWSERLKESQFKVKEEELKMYFPLDRVLLGLFALIERLFAVHIKEVSPNPEQVWHPDVRLYYIFPSSSSSSSFFSKSCKNKDKENLCTPVAAFYLDPFSRPGRKKAGNWMHPMATKSVVLQQQMPLAHIVLNMTPPLGVGEQALLTLDEVETLFHEMGHGLQHMLTTVKHGAVSGINNIAWDAVELPSQFMENWVYDKHTVCSFAQHYVTGDPLPETLFNKMKAARDFQAGRRLLQQLYLGALDLSLHSVYNPKNSSGQTPLQFMHTYSNSNTDNSNSFEDNHSLAQFLLAPLCPEDHSLCSFSHIFSGGYAAGYYSYLWAEVMSADAFAAFEEVGVGSMTKEAEAEVRATGLRFRDTVLGLGGSTAAADVFRQFRGRNASPTALLRHRGMDVS